MTVPREIVIRIAEAVEAQGGDLEDAHDLLEVWERLCSDRYGRGDRMAHENRERQREAQR